MQVWYYAHQTAKGLNQSDAFFYISNFVYRQTSNSKDNSEDTQKKATQWNKHTYMYWVSGHGLNKVIKLVKFSAIFHYALTVLWPSMHFSQNVQNTEQNANAYQ